MCLTLLFNLFVLQSLILILLPIYCSCGCDEYDYNPEDFFTCDICGEEKICCEKCYTHTQTQNNKDS